MARLPDRYNLSGPASLRSGRQISSADETPMGRGLQSLGGAIGQAGRVAAQIDQAERQRRQVADTAAANTDLTVNAIEFDRSFESDVDFDTLEARAAAKANDIVAKAGLAIRDPEARELWSTQAKADAAVMVRKVSEAGQLRQRRIQQVTVEQTLQSNRSIYTDPGSSPEQVQRARSAIEGTLAVSVGSGIFDPQQAARLSEYYLDGADFDRAKLDQNLPTPREGYFAAIRAAESGGDDEARNPRSSATGRYQFITSTWESLMRQFPDAGLTPEGRTDPAQQERAIRLFTSANEQQLAAGGIAPTNANLYSAHFLGAAGAVKVLRSPDDAALSGLVDPEVMKANPFLAGMTVKDFKAWAEGKVGRDPVMPDYFQRLTPEQRQVVLDMRDDERRKAISAANAEATLEYRRRDEALTLGIVTGSIQSEQQIMDAGLDDGDTAKHLRAFRQERGVEAGAAELLAKLASGEAVDLNPYDSADAARVDKAWDAFVQRDPEANRLDVASSFITATGVIPRAVEADMRRALNASDVSTVSQGLEYAARLNDVAPDAMRGAHQDLRDAVASYDTYVNQQAMTPTEAAQQMLRARDPASRRTDEALATAFKQALKDGRFGPNDLRTAFDTSWLFGGEPRLGVTPAQEMVLAEDYIAFAEQAFRRTNGNPDVSARIAIEEMRKTYGVSSVSGEPVLMRLPPENFYPPIDGGHQYLREAALEAARSIEPGAANVMLWPAEGDTVQDVRAGRPPRYNLFYTGENGAWEIAADAFVLTPIEFAAIREAASVRRRMQLDDARRGQQVPGFRFGGVLPGPMPVILGGGTQ